MLKKLLFIIASIFVGLILILNVMTSNFYNVFQKMTKEAVANKDYEKAERFYSYIIFEDKFYEQDLTDGTHIEIYAAINSRPYYEKTSDNSFSLKYNTLESAIQVSLFNLPKDFKLENATDQNGGVMVHMSNGDSQFFPYVDAEANLNYYNYVDYYSFLTLSVFENDLNMEPGVSITGIGVIDGSGEEKYSVELSNNPTFDLAFFEEYQPLLIEYNEYQKDVNDEIEDKDSKLEIVSQNILDLNASNDKYIVQHSVNIVYHSASFIWGVVLVTVIYIAIVAVLGYFLFRKRKAPKFVPKTYENSTSSNVVRQPEQFSRKDFIDADVEEAAAKSVDAEATTEVETTETEAPELETPETDDNNSKEINE